MKIRDEWKEEPRQSLNTLDTGDIFVYAGDVYEYVYPTGRIIESSYEQVAVFRLATGELEYFSDDTQVVKVSGELIIRRFNEDDE